MKNRDNNICGFFKLIGLIMFVLPFHACQAETETIVPLFKCSKKLQQPYGICSHVSRSGPIGEFDVKDKELSFINDIGATEIRTDFDWVNFRTAKDDSLNFGRFDQMINTTRKYDKNILGVISVTKRDLQDLWSRHTGKLIERYSQYVRYWEIVNEADLVYKRIPSFCAADYMDLLERGCKDVRSFGKGGKVLFSGMGVLNNNFADSVLGMGASKYFDIMNLHHYTNHDEPERFIEWYRTVAELMRKHNVSKPVWLTETGYPTGGKLSVDEREQALRLPRVFLISFACGIDKVYWYKSRSREEDDNDREHHFGICHKDFSPKPAYYTYTTLTRMCPNKSTRPVLKRCGRLYVASWKRPDGKMVWAIWTSRNEIVIDLKIKGNYKLYDVEGNLVRNKNLQSYSVSNSVTYIVGAKKLEYFC